MTDDSAIVAVYRNHKDAENAIKELDQSGFDMRKLSIIGKDFHSEEHVMGYYDTGERMKIWGKLGAFWGALWGMLFGSGIFLIPGIGPIVMFGPLVGWMLSVLEGAIVFGGVSAFGAALLSVGIPKNDILKYETSLKANKFLVIAHGTCDEILSARNVLDLIGSPQIFTHQANLMIKNNV